MLQLVRRIRDTLIDTPDSVCLDRARLATEAWKQHEHDPPPLRTARVFAHILANIVLDLDSNPLLAGNTSSRPRAWMLVPEHGMTADTQVLIENDGLDHLLDENVPEDLRAFWADRSFSQTAGGAANFGHLAVNMKRVVEEGLEVVIAEAESRPDERDEAKRTYRQAMVLACRAVIDWAGRYAEAAEKAARAADDPLVRRAHQRVAEACRHVPAKPARNLFEGLQAMALVHLATVLEGQGMSTSVGLPDRALARFDDEAGEDGDATALVAAFFLKIASNSLYGRGSKTQAITVGGADHAGRDVANRITLRFLDACDLVRVGDPHLFVRWHPALGRQVKRRAIDMLGRGVSMPLLVGDVPTARGFVEAGVTEEDAWDYCIIGCNELGIPGRSSRSALPVGSINYIDLLNEVLLDDGSPVSISDTDALLERLEQRMADRFRHGSKRAADRLEEAATHRPTPFTSSLMDGCPAQGRDLLAWQKYGVLGSYERGLTNAINAMAAIEQRVFGDGALTMAELVDAMKSDFAGDGAVRPMLLAAPRWGCGDDRADKWANVLLAMRDRAVRKAEDELHQPRHMPCHVVRSLHHVDGRRIAASPDGRRAGTPVADSIGPEMGTAARGPTAALNSVLKIDAARYYPGGYNLNLTLPGTGVPQSAILALVETFFDGGGQELQISCLDPAVLRDAQRHPERHRDLVVRIAGFSALFVKLSRAEQDELIARAVRAS